MSDQSRRMGGGIAAPQINPNAKSGAPPIGAAPITVTRALTLLRPWSHLILHGDKRVENRTWRIPSTIALPAWVALHNGKGHDDLGLAWLHGQPQLTACLRDIPPTLGGCIVGVMQLTGQQDLNRELYTGPGNEAFAHGPWAWHIGAVVALPRPIPARGFQGLWSLTPVQRGEIARQLAEVQP